MYRSSNEIFLGLIYLMFVGMFLTVKRKCKEKVRQMLYVYIFLKLSSNLRSSNGLCSNVPILQVGCQNYFLNKTEISESYIVWYRGNLLPA
jgi:hypothetical protein